MSGVANGTPTLRGPYPKLNPNASPIQDPVANTDGLFVTVRQLKSAIDSLIGQTGRNFDRAATLNDLVALGLITTQQLNSQLPALGSSRVDRLETGLDKETRDRTAADDELQANIDAEEAARIAADTTLQANIDAEATARSAADAAEASARSSADAVLQAEIDAIHGADPTALASDVAVNGVSTFFMRSDAAPAIQKASSSSFGVAMVDGVTVLSTGGVLSATTGGTGGGTGTVTSVTAGTGLTGGTITTAGTIALSSPVAIANGGTGATTAGGALSNLGGISGNQTITVTGDVDGSGTTAIALTLDTVNSNVGTFQGITVNGKGLVTAAANQSYLTANQTITLSGDLSGSGTTSINAQIAANAVGTTEIANANVTYAKIQNVTAARLLGNPSGSAAAPSEISLGTNLSFAGTVLNATAAAGGLSGMTAGQIPIAATATTVTSSANLSGDVASNATLVTTIATNVVSAGKFRQSVARSVVGNATNATANVTDIVGTTNQVLRVDSAGTALGFGAIDISQTAAVTGTLPVARGGTNKTSWTAGSVVFAASATALGEDNANLFWDDTNNRLGVGTTTPHARLSVNGMLELMDTQGIGINSYFSGGWFYNVTGGAASMNVDANGLHFYAAASGTGGAAAAMNLAVSMTSLGFVGIGTSLATPSYQLHVKASTDTVQAVIAGVSKGVRVLTGTTGTNIEGVDQTGTGSYQPLTVYGSTMTVGSAGAVILIPTTNVGVGTTTPHAKLAVNGDIGVAGPYGLLFNTYYSGGWIYETTGTAGLILVSTGMNFYVAASGTGGTAATQVLAARLDSFGSFTVTTNIYMGGQTLEFSGSTGGVGGAGPVIYMDAANAVWKLGNTYGAWFFRDTTSADRFLFVAGDGTAQKTGSLAWITISDLRLKEKVAPYQAGLAQITQLEPISFEYNGRRGTPQGKTFVGLSARDVQPVMPEMVGIAPQSPEKEEEQEFVDDPVLTLDAGPLVYALVNAVKELSARLAALEARV